MAERTAAQTGQLADELPQQLLDGSRYAEVLTDGNYRICGEWDADAVIVPLARWNTLLAHLRTNGVKTLDGGQR